MFRKMKDEVRQNEEGFSLVELIVVIAIMAVLAAVIAPNAIGQIEKSRVSNVVATVEGFKTGVVLFDSEEGRFPNATKYTDDEINLNDILDSNIISADETTLEDFLDRLPGSHPWGGNTGVYQFHRLYLSNAATPVPTDTYLANTGNVIYLVLFNLATDSLTSAESISEEIDGDADLTTGKVQRAAITTTAGNDLLSLDGTGGHIAIEVTRR